MAKLPQSVLKILGFHVSYTSMLFLHKEDENEKYKVIDNRRVRSNGGSDSNGEIEIAKKK